jgi:transcriptional regulator with XRE-family HTH domain
MRVGDIIRRIRKEKNLKLVELSKRSGVALATLSRMEHGKMTGTIDSHMKICDALEINLPDLYRNLSNATKTVDFRARNTKADVFVHNKRSSAEILASKVLHKKMMPVLIRIDKDGSTDREETKPGVERFVYVADGKVTAYIGEQMYALMKGDTLYFESSLPHHFANTGTSEVRLISVTCPPNL